MALDFSARANGQPSRGRRRGRVFSVRVTDDERAALERMQRAGGGPRALGPWLVWRAMQGQAPGKVLPLAQVSVTPTETKPTPPVHERVILDLCAGSGSWSAPYFHSGYQVVEVDIRPAEGRAPIDVHTYTPPPKVWGILAAPPCTEFSIAKNGQRRDFLEGMACVNACMRIILQARPRWWALENPTGLLGEFLGTPRDVFEPCDFGDPWTKRTAIWGDFAIPTRGPFVVPTGSAMKRSTAAARAVTPPGFARAFFEANP